MATYTFEDLGKTYHNFQTPVAVLTVDGENISDSTADLVLNDLDIELTAGFEAAIASFCLYNVYDPAEESYRFSEFSKYVQIGRKVEISLGYMGQARTVFSGIILRVNFLQEPGGYPYVQATAMDVKGLMMSGCSAKQLQAKSYSAAVKEIFNRSAYSGWTLSVDDTPDAREAGNDESRTLELVNESDYEFVVRAAKRYHYEFFADTTTIYFRKARKNKEILMELKKNGGILSFDIGYDITGLVNDIEARGMDPGKGTILTASKHFSNRVSTGQNASKLLSGSQKTYIDPTITSKTEAQNRAESLAEQMAYRFGSLDCTCIGMPELAPGRFIRIKDLGGPADNTFYLQRVRHVFDSDNGYRTILTGETAGLGFTP